MLKSTLLILFLLSPFACSSKKEDAPEKKIVKKPEKIKLKLNTVKGTKAGQRLVPKIKLKKAEAHLAAGQWEKALALYDELSKLSSLTAEARTMLFAGMGEAYRGLKRYEEAVVSWEKVMAIRKEDPEPYQNIGLIYKEAKKYRKALEFFRKTLKVEPFKLDVRLEIIDLYNKLGEPQKVKLAEAKAFMEHHIKMVTFLEKMDAKTNVLIISKYLDYLLEMPRGDKESAVPVKFLKKALAHKSTIIRAKAGQLASRTPEGAKEVERLYKNEKHPRVKKTWKEALSLAGIAAP